MLTSLDTLDSHIYVKMLVISDLKVGLGQELVDHKATVIKCKFADYTTALS